MKVELTDQEYQLVTQLLESRISELHPMIRRSRVYQVTDSLKEDLKTLKSLLDRMRQPEPVSHS